MSSMEFNKGLLVPVNIDFKVMKELLASKGKPAYHLDEELLEDLFNDEFHKHYVQIDGEWYGIESRINSTELLGLEYANKTDDGSIEFMTYHYNGGAFWTEVIEGALKNHPGELKVQG